MMFNNNLCDVDIAVDGELNEMQMPMHNGNFISLENF